MDAPLLGTQEKGEIFLSGELLLGNPRYSKRRFWKWTTLSIGAPLGNWRGMCFLETFKRQMEGFGNGPSLWELCEGNLEEGHLYWGPRGYTKKVQETGISLHWGTAEEPGGGAHLLGTLKDRQRRGQEI